mmetsp:Transcript_29769/g.75777  ORF Transcript_29769/g.75777 Transcript_29769/m.75777 type:complete len:323 (-) Transcript_29769:109-1077(-)|eukprot:CAMPEP_0195140204 /NCGR_PEP_ID=MMETSP0448-20130528/160751_1 /TAXON_ID=66468 /ORGANISM="Heterocapsa triquestra, Strain CCMP 448" /LENGTH=322 /DNA_ID=CAMNT_0040178533 /DNA_START=41 /DNA_END=1009 /DNA_ORIENTATION=-
MADTELGLEDDWGLDEADAALESFMQEDALLDAIQDAPEVPGLGGFGPLGRAVGGLNPGAGAASLPDECDELLTPGVSGPKERRVQEAGAQRSPAAEAAHGVRLSRQKTPPWRGALLTIVTLVGMYVWGPELFWEDAGKQKFVPAPPPAMPQILLPPGTEEENKEAEIGGAPEAATATVAASNVTRFGVRRGRAGVKFGTDFATNRAAAVDAAPADTAPADVVPADAVPAIAIAASAVAANPVPANAAAPAMAISSDVTAAAAAAASEAAAAETGISGASEIMADMANTGAEAQDETAGQPAAGRRGRLRSGSKGTVASNLH